jgi:hypothetical protein
VQVPEQELVRQQLVQVPQQPAQAKQQPAQAKQQPAQAKQQKLELELPLHLRLAVLLQARGFVLQRKRQVRLAVFRQPCLMIGRLQV